MSIDFQKLSRELAAHGQIIEAGWLTMRMTALPTATPHTQLEDMRTAFYAGASHLLATLLPSLPMQAIAPADLQRLMQMHFELDQFVKQLEFRQMPTRGNA